MDTSRTTEATTTPEMTGRTGAPSGGVSPFRPSTSLKEVTQHGQLGFIITIQLLLYSQHHITVTVGKKNNNRETEDG